MKKPSTEKFEAVGEDHDELSNRIKAYEDQLVLDDDLIAMQILTDNGWKYAMTLSQGKLSFYSNGVEISYFSDNRMTIEAAGYRTDVASRESHYAETR